MVDDDKQDPLLKIPLVKISPEVIPNPHDVPVYKKTKEGDVEFMGPLTIDAFKQTDFYKETLDKEASIIAPGLTPDMRKLTDIDPVAVDRIDARFGIASSYNSIDRSENSDTRVLVQSELGVDGTTMEARRVIVGRLDTLHMPVDHVRIDSIHDLKTGQKFNVEADPTNIVLSSETSGLMQPEADKLAGQLTQFSLLLDASKPNKSGDERATVQLASTGIGDYLSLSGANTSVRTTSDKLLRNLNNILDMPNTYGLALNTATLAKLDEQIDNGNFSKTLAVTDTDPATGKESHRVLLGSSKYTNGKDPLTGQAIYDVTFTKSFNIETGKASVLETPIVLQVADGYTRQENIDGVVNQVRAAVEKKEISMVNPQFDELLKNADKVALGGYEGAPSTPSASVAGKKVPSVA